MGNYGHYYHDNSNLCIDTNRLQNKRGSIGDYCSASLSIASTMR
jgi:hypothetical protein